MTDTLGMTDTLDKAVGVVLVKNGKWQVPPEQRPRNWRDILPEATEHPEPTQEAVAVACVEVAEATRADDQEIQHEPSAPVDPWLDHRWIDLRQAIEQGAEWFGADRELTGAALVLAAGMWTRKIPILRKMTGCPHPRVVAQTCYFVGLWSREHMGVVLGELEKEHGDLEFWMNAMAANGDLHRHPDGTSCMDNFWGARLRELMRACGWSMKAAGKKFDYKGGGPIKRLLEGGRPTVDQVLRLRTLEQAYAGEIEALRDGRIEYKRYRPDGPETRVDWRPRDQRSPRLETMGEEMGSLDEEFGPPIKTYKLVSEPPKVRPYRRENRKAGSRQPAADGRGPEQVTEAGA